ncbi:MAG: hypothetical protein ACOX1V_02525 [Candidatus Iainarchaeum sp.]
MVCSFDSNKARAICFDFVGSTSALIISSSLNSEDVFESNTWFNLF